MFADELALLNEFEREGDDGLFSSHRHQLVNAPLLKLAALQHRLDDFPSRGLLGVSDGERIYINTNAPNSGVVCGVQGSGKSHTLACILENALISSSRIGALPEPLAALVFHFDQQECGRPCEAAFLASPAVTLSGLISVPRVTVLCSPSNLVRRTQAYSSLTNVQVEPLFLSEQDLTVDRMLSLMGCDNLEAIPLYMNTVLRIMRSMGIDRFTYSEFKRQLAAERLQGKQNSMLKLRLDLLDSYLRPESPNIRSYFAVGEIVLVDLTDPFLDGTTAGLLFDIVLDSFVGWQAASGKIVVLDEAHKFLTSSESSRLNQSLANTIRLQRHLATRVIIATQEPTVVPRTILDLSTFIVCHRFSSPSWCEHLSRHVNSVQSGEEDAWFKHVMLLATGESIVFSPTTLVSVNRDHEIELLGGRYLKVKVRPRLTCDGGRSLLAVGQASNTRSVVEADTSIIQPTQMVTSDNSMLPLGSNVVDLAELAGSSTSSALPVPFSAPVTVSSATTSTISSPVTTNSRFDGLVAFLREQQARGIHQVTWSDVAENVRLRHAVDGTPLRVRAFLGEAAEEGMVSVTGEPEDGTDWVSLLPVAPIPTTVPPTTGSVPSPFLSLTLPLDSVSNPQPAPLIPTVRFQALVAFLEQQRANGVVQVPLSVAQAAVNDRQGPSESQKPAHFLADAIQEGIVVVDACITPTWVALPPSSSSTFMVHSTTRPESTAATLSPSSPDVIAADVSPRFRPLVDFLQQQHASGAPRVSLTLIGEGVSRRTSANGKQMKAKAFVNDALRSGVVFCGGVGKERWVALRNEQTDFITSATAQSSVTSTSIVGYPLPPSEPAIRDPAIEPLPTSTATTRRIIAQPLESHPPAVVSWSRSESTLAHAFAELPSEVTMPDDFRSLVNLLQAQHAVGQAEVPWSVLASSLFHLRNTKSRFTRLINDAVAAGVVETGGPRVAPAGYTWVKLATPADPEASTSAAGPTSTKPEELAAQPSITAVPSRFKPLVIQLQTRQALGQAKVKSSVLRTNLQHLFTSKVWFKQLINDSIKAGVIVMGEVGNTQLEWAELVLPSHFVYTE